MPSGCSSRSINEHSNTIRRCSNQQTVREPAAKHSRMQSSKSTKGPFADFFFTARRLGGKYIFSLDEYPNRPDNNANSSSSSGPDHTVRQGCAQLSSASSRRRRSNTPSSAMLSNLESDSRSGRSARSGSSSTTSHHRSRSRRTRTGSTVARARRRSRDARTRT